MLHKKLFKLNSNGKSIQTWEIHNAEDFRSYFTVSGQVEGKKTIAAPHAVTPKVNRTQEQQILLEMNSKVKSQIRKKYVENIDDVGKKADDALPGYTAMTAKKWPEQKKHIKFPCFIQPKFDGIRCLATKDGLFTRGRKVIEACQHVHEELKPFFVKYPDARLDGELYTHEFKHDFEKIVKAVRKSGKRVTQDDLDLQAKLQYHIYDMPRAGEWNEEKPFALRFDTDFFFKFKDCKSLVIAPTLFVTDEEDLYKEHTKFLLQGYEGSMVRNIEMPYEGKRSNNLLKMKEFDEEEFKIVDVKEGKGGLAGHCGALVFQTDDGTRFQAKLIGSHERLKWIWNNPDSVLNKMGTVKFQGLTNKEHVPRFPIAKDVRGLEDRSDWL